MATMTARDQIVRDEGGMLLKAYRDSEGIWTIGVGHNLEARPIPRAAGIIIFEVDLADTILDVDRALPWAARLDECRRAVLINMAFNLGIHGLLDFRRMLAAVQAADWPLASKEMLDSKWATQVGGRALRLAQQMETGAWV